MNNKYNYLILLILSFLSMNVAAGVVTFSCDFPNYVNDKESGTQNFKLEFNLDTVSGQSFIKGNNGMAEVMNIPGSDGVSFIEIIGSGAVQTTTVVFLPESQFGSAVHSRHTLMMSGLVPSQNYGYCNLSDN